MDKEQVVHELTMLFLQKNLTNSYTPEEFANQYMSCRDKIITVFKSADDKEYQEFANRSNW